jgi:hypothetical protein
MTPVSTTSYPPFWAGYQFRQQMGNQHIYKHKFPAANETRQQAGRQARCPDPFPLGKGSRCWFFTGFWLMFSIGNHEVPIKLSNRFHIKFSPFVPIGTKGYHQVLITTTHWNGRVIQERQARQLGYANNSSGGQPTVLHHVQETVKLWLGGMWSWGVYRKGTTGSSE